MPDKESTEGHPTIGLSMIVRDEEQLLPGMLESVRSAAFDQIVIVDTGSVDGTRAVIARENNHRTKAQKLPPIETHSFEWVNDFSAARNFSFSKMHTNWVIWLDADDVVENAEALRGIAAEQAPDIGAVWLPYFYAFDEYGTCTTLFDRERLLHMRVGWEWVGAIHETAAPQGMTRYARSTAVRVYHRTGYSDTRRGDRNLQIILKAIEGDPEARRNWLYLAHQYLAQQDYARALEWYTYFHRDRDVQPMERWQAMVYAAKACHELGDYQEQLRHGFMAIMAEPQYADGHLEVAEAYMKIGDWMKAIEHAEVAKHKEPPDRILFVNTLDYTYRPHTILNVCYWQAGQVEQALEECNAALQIRPNEESLLHNKALFEDALQVNAMVEAYQTMAGAVTDKEAVRLAKNLRGFKQDPRARDIWVPAQLRLTRRGSQPSVDVFTGLTLEEWTPAHIERQGLGGSETAVVEIAKRLQAAGYCVTVYGNPGGDEGWYDGVGYLDWKRFQPSSYRDVMLVWRNSSLGPERIDCREKWLWMHDLNHGEKLTERNAQGFDRVFGVSEWHANHMEYVYPFLRGKTSFVYNGINPQSFGGKKARKQHGKAVYSSSPDRGLTQLLNLWPAIKQSEPAAELHIFYGWDALQATIDKGINPSLQIVKDTVEPLLKQPGVFWRGRLPQRELHREFLSADLFLYPTPFAEVFCISAVEAMAAGLIPVTTRHGALPEVIGDAGLLVPGITNAWSYAHLWLGCALAAMGDLEIRQTYRAKGPARAQEFTWDRAAARWLGMLTEVIDGKVPNSHSKGRL